MRTVSKQCRLKEAMDILHVTDQRCMQTDCSTYGSLLQECIDKTALPEGKLVHAHMIGSGVVPDIFLQTKLVIMYAKCGSLLDGCRVLYEMSKPNVVSWTEIIAGYVRQGEDEEALTLFNRMRRTGVRPNQFTFAIILPACANLAALKHGKEVHEDIIRNGFQYDVFVERGLVDMYIKCGSTEDARHVFDKMSERSISSWTAMIAGYVGSGRVSEAVELFQKMPERNMVSWNVMIAGYIQNGYVDDAFQIFQKTPEQNVVSWNAMIAGYSKHGNTDEALKLFQKMAERNVVSWTGMIAGHAQNGHFNEALSLFREMQLTGVKPNCITFFSVLPACANLAAVDDGKKIHEDIIRRGFQSDVLVERALLDMHMKCGRIPDACKVFDKMSEPDVVSWTVMIAGYARNGQVDQALKLFQKMSQRNVVSWNAIVAGYAQNGYVDEGLKLFQKMPERNAVSWNAMFAGYAQNEHVNNAWNLFQKMPERDLVSWNTMIAGCAQNGHFSEALKLFRQMQRAVVKPDSITYSSVLPACANLAALKHGKEVHENIIRSGFLSDVFVGDALVDMYAKCGCMEDAYKVFDKMVRRTVVSWTAMIVGYAMHGYGKEALQLFEQMQHFGTKPNHVTFIGVLPACCHAGLVDDGWRYFDCMSRDYNIVPIVDHYCCMVDLLGRAGRLGEAQNLIDKMPVKPTAVVWGSLLGACRIHANVELGEFVAEHLFELDPTNATHYVLLSNIYAAVGRWDDVEKVRNLMKERGVNKRPGCSWIEVNSKVHAFLVGDRSDPQMHRIYAKLERSTG